MACPVCPTAGWLGGWVGGYLGINPPEHPGAKLLSASLTANFISMTLIAMKEIFNVSLCKGGTFTFDNIVRVSAVTLILGIIYSVGVNALLNRYVFPASEEPPQEEENPPCCCHK